MNKNPTQTNASENITFILTGKYPKTFLEEYKEKQKKLLEEIFNE